MKIFIYFLVIYGNFIFAQNQLTNFGSLYIFPNASVALKGNLQNNGTLNSSGGTLFLNGSSGQTISGSAMPEFYNLTMNNTSVSGVTLAKNVQIANLLLFIDGVVNSSSGNQLILIDNSTVSGASTNSYNEGPISKIGNDEFIFPVGISGNYQPIAISAPALSTDRFQAEYFDQNPQSAFGTAMEFSIDHLSTCEYWNIQRISGSSSVSITPGWNLNSCGVTEILDLIVTHWDSTQWINLGNGGLTGDFSLGTIRTFSPESDFGIFTIGSISDENPLPVELISFEAQRNEENVELNWATASERENSFFSIEKTIDGMNFELVDVIPGSGNTNQYTEYSLTDESPFEGLSYYRLKQTDADGKFIYSDLRSVYFGEEKTISLFPNPGNGEKLYIVRSKAWVTSTIEVYDFGGRLMFSLDYIPYLSNEHALQLDFATPLPGGVYMCKISSTEDTEQVRFIVK